MRSKHRERHQIQETEKPTRVNKREVSRWQLWSGFRNQLDRLDESVAEELLGEKNVIDELMKMLTLSKISACFLKYLVEYFWKLLNDYKVKQNEKKGIINPIKIKCHSEESIILHLGVHSIYIAITMQTFTSLNPKLY